MAVLITKCPHCGTEAMAFHIFGALSRPDAAIVRGHPFEALVAAACNGCNKPIAGLVQSVEAKGTESHGTFFAKMPMLMRADQSLDSLRIRQAKTWPEASSDVVPDSLPEQVDRSFRQAERNFRQPDCEEAAATMYRRALDLGIKIAHPEVKGSLDQKITKLVSSHDLPPSIGEWAHAVRLVGNDGAHDIEGVTRSELDDARAFIDTVLRYMFTLPAKIAARGSFNPPA
jgi:hypothetical protein